MSKSLYLINSINDVPISVSYHMEQLMPFIKELGNIDTVLYDIDTKDMMKAIDDINKNADIVFIMHDFTLWNDNLQYIDNGRFSHFIRSIWNNKNIFVFPTQLGPTGLIKSQFKDNINLMNKIIVGTEAVRKIFIKTDMGLSVPSNKIKHINIPTDEFVFANADDAKLRQKITHKILFTPGLLGHSKDYVELLKNYLNIKRHFKNTIYIMALKSHPGVSQEIVQEEFKKIQNFIYENNLNEVMRLSLDYTTIDKYNAFMRIADIVVFPQDDSMDIYNGCIIDALGMGKAVVAPNSPFAEDLAKKTSVLLYQYKNELSYYDVCTTILSNKPLKQIIEQHNYEYGQNITYRKIAQQYINQIKRFKFN